MAKTTSLSSIISVSEYPADLTLIKKFLEGQRGTTILTLFKIVALSATGKGKSNAFRDYYLFLMGEKKYAEYNARHTVARKIAAVAYCVMKSGRRYDPDKLR